MSAPNPQIIAADPAINAFVTANAGSGKTRTLVDRVARLLLRGARPEAILCVTYTKAAAAEMQRRLFETLGAWAVADDLTLARRLEEIGEKPRDLGRARQLFALALETPGGLKIQTIHAFCEKLLRRFPLEAGVSPGFQVLEEQAARAVSDAAREAIAHAALRDPQGALGQAYARMAADLDFRSFNEMFACFEARRRALAAYFAVCAEADGVEADVWRRCGFTAPEPAEDIRRRAVSPPALDPELWREGARALAAGGSRDQSCAACMGEVAEGALRGEADFDTAIGVFCTGKGEPAKWLETAAAMKANPGLQARLAAERDRLVAARQLARAAKVAEDSVTVLLLAQAFIEVYAALKGQQAGLDFDDLIERTNELLTVRTEAAWVLYKLDGGVDHILLDEAQDTAPDQWGILRALSGEFFAGAGVREAARTVFAVGDEKQSIFSFQGAAPERFLAEAREYGELIEGAGGDFRAPALLKSYRSAPEVLEVVDAVFREPRALAGLRPEEAGKLDIVTHEPNRGAGEGCVELWPLEKGDEAAEQDPWAPLDQEPPQSANKKLARRIAREVKAAIARKDAVWDRDKGWRACEAGDFLILVRRRNALFQEIIRALKKEGVAVGGADRLKLSDHILFDDLLALARFVLFPHDDLSLACLLKSPFCEVDEEGLYDLAQPRSGSLWAELNGRAEERPPWAAALEFLHWTRQAAEGLQPFDFYGQVLSRTDVQGRSMRARLLTRLGTEAQETLEAFLAETLAAEGRGARDLESFAAAMAGSEIEVKREQEDGKGYVRVMTVHGAKGLEAPVVILPDTTTRAKAQGAPLLRTLDGGFLWCSRGGDDCEATALARQARTDSGDDESLRLLYVALTRARDRLIVCGVALKRPNTGFEELSWWDYVCRGFADAEAAPKVREVTAEDGWTIRRYGADPQPGETAASGEAAASPLPTWVRAPAAPEPPARRYASPSQMAEQARGPAPSPLAQVEGLSRLRRGEVIHRLLQLLPDVPQPSRDDAAKRMLARELDLTDTQREEMIAAALGVLADARFAEVFGPGSRAEVALAGTAAALPVGLPVSGRIDRLVVTPERVLVADYKSNRPSPDRIEDADPAYLIQMAVYVAVLREVFPGRAVEAALVWTDGPKLMPLPESLIEASLADLRARR
ncbi:MAG TPA: double-strand break repair helicase AddA [Caulobacteraceae bacterium]